MPNTVTLLRKNYSSKEEFYLAAVRLFEVLCENGYQISVKYEDVGVMVIAYDYLDLSMSEYDLLWVKNE